MGLLGIYGFIGLWQKKKYFYENHPHKREEMPLRPARYLRVPMFAAVALPVLLVLAAVLVTLQLQRPAAIGQSSRPTVSKAAEQPVTEIYYSQCGHKKPVEGTVSGLTAPGGVMVIDGYCPNHYLIKRAPGGRVEVYRLSESHDVPVMTLDINTSWLPEADRAALEEGIRVDSERELVSLIEDYTS